MKKNNKGMIPYVEERDLGAILSMAYTHDGQSYVQYIKEVIQLPSNRLLVEYIDGKLFGWVGFHKSSEGDWDHLYATSLNNDFPISMWREVRKIVKDRPRALISGITENFATIERLGKLYGGEYLEEYGCVVFRDVMQQKG